MQAYIAWRNHEPPLYMQQTDMPCEVSLVFRHCVNWEMEAAKGEAQLAVAQEQARRDTEALKRQVNPYGEESEQERTLKTLRGLLS